MGKQVESLYGKQMWISGFVATGAMRHRNVVAEYLGLPLFMFRPKQIARAAKPIEGKLEANQSVVVIEDLIRTGKSSLNARWKP